MSKLTSKIACLFFLYASYSHSSIIFDFTIDDLGTSSANTVIGDQFSISFVDSTNFLSGISATDIDTIYWDTDYLGTGSFNPTGSALSGDYNNIFSFTDFGSGLWGLDLTIGETTESVAITLTAPGAYFQLGQSGGAFSYTSFVLGPSIDQFIFDGTDPILLSSQASDTNSSSVPVPGSFHLIGLGLAAMCFTRRLRLGVGANTRG